MKKKAFRDAEVASPDYPAVSALDRRAFLAGLGAALASAALPSESRAGAPDAGAAPPEPPRTAGAPPPEPPPARKGDVAVEHPPKKPPPPKRGKVAVDHLDEASPPPPAEPKKPKKLAK